jgi:hypothetical protein
MAEQAEVWQPAQSAAVPASRSLRCAGPPRPFPGFGASRTRLAGTRKLLYRAEGRIGTSEMLASQRAT